MFFSKKALSSASCFILLIFSFGCRGRSVSTHGNISRAVRGHSVLRLKGLDR